MLCCGARSRPPEFGRDSALESASYIALIDGQGKPEAQLPWKTPPRTTEPLEPPPITPLTMPGEMPAQSNGFNPPHGSNSNTPPPLATIDSLTERISEWMPGSRGPSVDHGSRSRGSSTGSRYSAITSPPSVTARIPPSSSTGTLARASTATLAKRGQGASRPSSGGSLTPPRLTTIDSLNEMPPPFLETLDALASLRHPCDAPGELPPTTTGASQPPSAVRPSLPLPGSVVNARNTLMAHAQMAGTPDQGRWPAVREAVKDAAAVGHSAAGHAPADISASLAVLMAANVSPSRPLGDSTSSHVTPESRVTFSIPGGDSASTEGESPRGKRYDVQAGFWYGPFGYNEFLSYFSGDREQTDAAWATAPVEPPAKSRRGSHHEQPIATAPLSTAPYYFAPPGTRTGAPVTRTGAAISERIAL